MGVNKTVNTYPNTRYIEDQSELTPLAPGPAQTLPVPESPPQKGRKPRSAASSPPKPQTFMRSKGYRQARRYQNTMYLLNMYNVEVDEFEEIDITDFISPGVSAFEELFLDDDSMEIWRDFMNRSGEEQERYLRQLETAGRQGGGGAVVLDNDRQASRGPGKTEAVDDERNDHPACYRPEDCYKRISGRFRSFLRQKHLPKGNMEFLEDELSSWFAIAPESVFVALLPSGYDRMLLHTICQYLKLNSSSADCEGVRATLVENPAGEFTPPCLSLTTYLETLT